ASSTKSKASTASPTTSAPNPPRPSSGNDGRIPRLGGPPLAHALRRLLGGGSARALLAAVTDELPSARCERRAAQRAPQPQTQRQVPARRRRHHRRGIHRPARVRLGSGRQTARGQTPHHDRKARILPVGPTGGSGDGADSLRRRAGADSGLSAADSDISTPERRRDEAARTLKGWTPEAPPLGGTYRGLSVSGSAAEERAFRLSGRTNGVSSCG